jgi:ABC-type bacteriocin/lantibiotic exporter with double-glycine peptidase domain
MKLCVLSWVVIICSIISTAADIYLIESTVVGISINILANVIFTFLLVLLTNWSCYSPTFYWIAWIVVAFTVIPTVAMPFIIINRNSPEIKKELEEEKKLRQ